MNTSSTKVASIRSRFEQNCTSRYQSDLVRLASSSGSKQSPRRIPAGSASHTTIQKPCSAAKRQNLSRDYSMSAMNLDTSFTCSTADDSYASVSGASLSERMQSAWYMIEGDDESGNE